MATREPGIQKIQGVKGIYCRAQVGIKGHRHLPKSFTKLRDARDSRIKTIDAMKSGRPYETTEMRQTTL